ncbi:pseudouridine synthase [Kiloniella laminariae]|uniref:pseudouridine synthase n=1 Tax=Kiloniella laminariae TaxID=454162 RepID=UPI0003A0DCCA|nr:pseudouridine synthase [Kiloniella laminariae]
MRKGKAPFTRPNREGRDGAGTASVGSDFVAAPASNKEERIAKVIARAGLCSRRDAERWIAEGRVQLDGKLLDSPAVVVGPKSQIKVDGVALPQAERARLWKFHKPKGLITAVRDPEGRPTVFDNLPKDLPRLQPVGRLDFNSEGLLLFTNDGEIKRRLELPSTGWKRRYRVRVHGQVEEHHIKALADGLNIDGIQYGPIEATIAHQAQTNAWMLMSLREGKNREIRRVCEHLGLIVNRLIRISYGPFQLSDLPPGEIIEIPPRLLKDQLGLQGDEADTIPEETSAKGGKKPPQSRRPASGKPGRSDFKKPGAAKASTGKSSPRRDTRNNEDSERPRNNKSAKPAAKARGKLTLKGKRS